MIIVKVLLSIIWGALWVTVGSLLIMTIYLVLPGILCLIIAGIPLAWTVKNIVIAHVEEEWREKPMPNDEEPPWEM